MPETDVAVWEEVSEWPFRAPSSAIATWGEAEWQAAKFAVLVHGIAPLLGATKDLSSEFHAAPTWFLDYLASQAALNALRVERMHGELTKITTAAQEADISVLPLKGGALLGLQFPSGATGSSSARVLAGQEHPDTGGQAASGTRSCILIDVAHRPLNDLDFLVRKADRDRFEDLLARLDYTLTEESPRHREFTCQRFGTEVVYREGEHPDNPIRVEVHTWVGQEMFSAARIDITEAMWQGGTTPRALMLHLAMHAGANTAKRRLRLIQLIDLVRLAPALSEEDWAWLVSQAQHAGAAHLVATAIRLGERFSALAVPRTTSPLSVAPDLDTLLRTAPLHTFTHLGGPLTLAWELHWLAPRARLLMRLRRALPLHRLLLSPVRLRERYGLPLDAHPARAYAIHLTRAALWPLIYLLRLAQGTR